MASSGLSPSGSTIAVPTNRSGRCWIMSSMYGIIEFVQLI